MALPAFLARLLVWAGAHRLFPELNKRLDGGADTLRYWSARLLTAPFDALLQAGDYLAPDGPDIIDLATGSPRFDLGAHPPRTPMPQRGWPPIPGLPELRGAVASHLLAEHNVSYSPTEEILVTSGGLGAVNIVLDAFADRGDAVVLPSPISPMYPLLLQGRGLSLRWVPARNEDGQMKLRLDLLSSSLRGAKILVLCSPCNPTGACYTPDELDQISWWAERRDVLILSDESFAPLCHDDGHTATATVARARARTLTVGSLSKGHALAWARVGWLAGHKHLVKACVASAGLRGSFVPYPCQAVALTALQNDDAREGHRQRFESRRCYVLERLKAIGLGACWPSAGFFAWFPTPKGHDSGFAFTDALYRSAKVRLVPGEMFGPEGAGHARLSFALDEGRLEEGLNRIGDFVRQARIAAPAFQVA
jgi:aminotransferase